MIITKKSPLGSKFPARLISIKFDWEYPLLKPKTSNEINQLKKHLAAWQKKNKNKSGIRALFYGSSFTDKILTVASFAKQLRRPFCYIDLSQIVNKYIGETEKNLEKLFKKAENSNWILFFDEADALFGKRTNVRDSHDRYANIEINYLLKKIEDYRGITILSSNKKTNIDQSFTRRLRFIIRFPKNDLPKRNSIWKNTIPKINSAIKFL